jgi:Tfp pilus assembly protein FimT
MTGLEFLIAVVIGSLFAMMAIAAMKGKGL